jgi:hypothetical protein
MKFNIKREYFGMLFMAVSVALIIFLQYIFGEEKITEYLAAFIVIWLLIAYQVGKYSMRFPKAF